MIITFVFKNLDKRTASLIKDAEKSLKVIEVIKAKDLNMNEIQLIEAAENKKGNFSYRQSLNILFALGYALGFFGLAHGTFNYCNV